MAATKGRKRKQISNLMFLASIILAFSLFQKNVLAKKSRKDPDSEDLEHLRSQLNKLLKQQKIFNLIKKKGKLMKLAMQEDGQTTQENPEAPIEETAVAAEAVPVEVVPEAPLQVEEPVPAEAEAPEVEAVDQAQVEEAPPVVESEVAEPPSDTQEAAPVEVAEEAPQPVEEPVTNVEETPVEAAAESTEESAQPAEAVAEVDEQESTQALEESLEKEAKKKECSKDDSDEECLEKRLKSKLVHLLGVFDSLYSSMEEVCQASESVCKKILDRIKEFENLRPESNQQEMEVALKETVKETADNVFEIAKQQLELKGEENIKNLRKVIDDERERLIEGFKPELPKFESEDQMKTQCESHTTKVLKNIVENFYLNDYLKTPEGEAASEESESSEAEEPDEDPEDTLIQEITGDADPLLSVANEETKNTNLARVQKTKVISKSKKKKMKKKSKKNRKSKLDLDLDSLSDKTALELLSSLLK